MAQPQPQMLEGFHVLDFTHYVAGPTCTRILGELGADVIKVERSLDGDHVRQLGIVKDGMSSYYFQHNHCKRSLAVDLRQPRGRELLLARANRFPQAMYSARESACPAWRYSPYCVASIPAARCVSARSGAHWRARATLAFL